MPASIFKAIVNRRATLHELDTVYGLEDLFCLLEMIDVESWNAEQMSEEASR